MMLKIISREQAWQWLTDYNENPTLLRHALAVEGVMRHLAVYFNEDPEIWGVVGLLHDIDYERFPEQHCVKAREILTGLGADPLYIHAVLSHGFGLCSDVEPSSLMEKTLYAIDELTGLIHAAAIMRPSGSVVDLEVKSVMKKYKQSSFAAGVDRSVIERGAQMMDMPLLLVVEQTILGMRTVADSLGLGLRRE